MKNANKTSKAPQTAKYVVEAGIGHHLVKIEYGIVLYSGNEMQEIFGGVNTLEDAEIMHKEIKNVYSGKNDKYLGRTPEGNHWVLFPNKNVAQYSSNEMDEVYSATLDL